MDSGIRSIPMAIRATALLERLEERYPRSADLRFARDVAAAASSALEQRPTIDFALATLTRVAGLPPGSGLALFAIGRTIGWIGHAIEQYASGTLIRPRAKYVGTLARHAERCEGSVSAIAPSRHP